MARRRFSLWWYPSVAILAAAGVFGWLWSQRLDPNAQARAAYEAQDYPLALRWANYRLREDPADSAALRWRGRSQGRMGDDADSLRTYQAIPVPELEDKVVLGIALGRTGGYAKAAPLLEDALARGYGSATDQEADLHRMLAVLYGQLDRDDEAIAHARWLVDHPPHVDLGRALLGSLMMDAERPAEAVAQLRTLFEENPKLRDVPMGTEDTMLNYIEAKLAVGEREGVEELFGRMGNIADDARALSVRSRFRSDQGRTAEAAEDAVRAWELKPGDVRLHIEASRALVGDDRPDEAEKLLRPAAARPDADPALLLELARVLRVRGATDEARAVAERAELERRRRQARVPDA